MAQEQGYWLKTPKILSSVLWVGGWGEVSTLPNRDSPWMGPHLSSVPLTLPFPEDRRDVHPVSGKRNLDKHFCSQAAPSGCWSPSGCLCTNGWWAAPSGGELQAGAVVLVTVRSRSDCVRVLSSSSPTNKLTNWSSSWFVLAPPNPLLSEMKLRSNSENTTGLSHQN